MFNPVNRSQGRQNRLTVNKNLRVGTFQSKKPDLLEIAVLAVTFDSNPCSEINGIRKRSWNKWLEFFTV